MCKIKAHYFIQVKNGYLLLENNGQGTGLNLW